jgi:hypothetical protein
MFFWPEGKAGIPAKIYGSYCCSLRPTAALGQPEFNLGA